MDLPNLKELSKLIALCRKQGVKTVRVGELELTLDEHFEKGGRVSTKKESNSSTNEAAGGNPEWDRLTDEEKLFWSADPAGPNVNEEPK